MDKPWGLASLHPPLLSEDLPTIPGLYRLIRQAGCPLFTPWLSPISKCRKSLSSGVWEPGLTLTVVSRG